MFQIQGLFYTHRNEVAATSIKKGYETRKKYVIKIFADTLEDRHRNEMFFIIAYVDRS